MNRALLTLIALLPACAEAQQTVRIQEWPVPWANSRPRDPYVDRTGAVWFVGQTGDYAARFDPRTAQFQKFPLDSGTGPHNLIVDDAGVVWYAGNRARHIGRLDPATGAIRKFMVPDTLVRDPHTLIFDRAGNIWFTAQQSGVVGRFTPTSGEYRIERLTTERSRPYGITLDARGRVWFNEFGTTKIGMIDPATFRVTEFDLPHERARGRRIAVTSDGAVWYVDYVRGKLARLDPETRRVEEYAAPGGEASLPYGLAVDGRDRLWFVETGTTPNRFVGFDGRTRRIISSTDLPTSRGVRHMFYHAPTNSIWFGTDSNTIGRATLPD